MDYFCTEDGFEDYIENYSLSKTNIFHDTINQNSDRRRDMHLSKPSNQSLRHNRQFDEEVILNKSPNNLTNNNNDKYYNNGNDDKVFLNSNSTCSNMYENSWKSDKEFDIEFNSSSCSSASSEFQPNNQQDTHLPSCFDTVLKNNANDSTCFNFETPPSPNIDQLISVDDEEGANISGYMKMKNTDMSNTSLYGETDYNGRYHHVPDDEISEQDLQTIIETNNSLKALLPQNNVEHLKKEENENYSFHDSIGLNTNPNKTLPSHRDTHREIIKEEEFEYNLDEDIEFSTNLPRLEYIKNEDNDLSFRDDADFRTNNSRNLPTLINENRVKLEDENFLVRQNIEFNNKFRNFDVTDNYDDERYRHLNNIKTHMFGGLYKDKNNTKYSNGINSAVTFEIQQVIKKERRKLKNRLAASKCRRKKLEREAQLEIHVNNLKDRRLELNSIAIALRNQATHLKSQIIEHLNHGCNVDLGSLTHVY